MRGPKILAVASAVDLDFRYGCTPAWWQLWKGMYEAGVDLTVTPYRGRPVESPWWRTEPNPTYREGEAYARVRDLAARFKGDRYLRRAEAEPGDTDRAQRELIWRWVTPRWKRHLERILERERDVDAVVVFTVPMSHLRGIPAHLRERFGVPVVFFVGDVPFNAFNHAIASARINLNLTRRAHAGLHASSTARPFELAMAGAAIVSNPYEGVERWFEPGQELLVARDEEEATALYGDLLADPSAAEELGRRARERALDEHTYAHRARRVLDLLGLTSQTAETVEAARGLGGDRAPAGRARGARRPAPRR